MKESLYAQVIESELNIVVFVVYRVEKKFNQLGFLRRINEEILAVCKDQESLKNFLLQRLSSIEPMVNLAIKQGHYTLVDNEDEHIVWKIKEIKLL